LDRRLGEPQGRSGRGGEEKADLVSPLTFSATDIGFLQVH